MKIKFLAVGFAVARYEIEGETITVFEKYVPPIEVIEPEPEPEPVPDEPEPPIEDEPTPIEPGEPMEPEVSIFENFDLSAIEFGGQFVGIEPEVVSKSRRGLVIPTSEIIRDVFRDEQGELHVTLCQETVGGGRWNDSDWIDASEYEPGKTYIYKVGQKNPAAKDVPIEPIPEPTPELPAPENPTPESIGLN